MSRRVRSAAAPPTYLRRVLALAPSCVPGRVTHVTVQHDADCPLLARRGPCACDPVAVLVQREGRAAGGSR